MPSSSDIRAGRAFVEIGTDGGPLERGLQNAKARIHAFSSAMGSMARQSTAAFQTGFGGLGASLQTVGSALALGFATNRVRNWIEAVADGGREIYLISRNLGVSVEQVQELKKAGELMGLEFDSSARGIERMRKFMADLAASGMTAAEMLASMGLESNAGAVLDEEQIARAYELSRAMQRLSGAVKSIGLTIASVLVPGFTAVYDFLTPIVRSVRLWVADNAELVQKIALIGSSVAGISAALIGGSLAINLVGAAARNVASVFGGLFGIVGSIVGLIASPLGVVLATATAIGVALGRYYGVFDRLAPAVRHVGAVFHEAFAGIRDAVASGDIEGAWEMALGSMKVLWIDFQIWWKDTFGTSLKQIWDAIKIGWIESVAFFKRLWVGAMAAMAVDQNASQNVGTAIAIGRIRGQMQRGEISTDVGRMTIAQLRAEQRIANEQLRQDMGFDAQLNAIEAERRAARDQVANAPPENLGGDRLTAEIDLENLRERLSIEAGAAAARREAQLRLIGTGLEAEGLDTSSAGSARSTFNRDVLWGYGSSPVQQLVNNTQRMIELLIPIRANIENLDPPRVG